MAILQQNAHEAISAADIIQIQTRGTERHTHVHPNIAIAVATWLSPGFLAAVCDLISRYMEGKVKSADSRAEAAAVQAASAPVPAQRVLPQPSIQHHVRLNAEQEATLAVEHHRLVLRRTALPISKQEDDQVVARQEALTRMVERVATAEERGAAAMERRATAKRRETDSTMACLAAKRQEMLTYPAQEEHARVMQARMSPIDPIPSGMFTFSQLIHFTQEELGLLGQARGEFRRFICAQHADGRSGYDEISSRAGLAEAAGGHLNTHHGVRLSYHKKYNGRNVFCDAVEAMKHLWQRHIRSQA